MDQDVEVEQKFEVPDGHSCRDVLQRAGARLLGEALLEDVYLDTAELQLLRQDCWLRMRGRTWELKMSASGGAEPVQGLSEYQEVAGEQAVREEVERLLPGTALAALQQLVRVVAVRQSWTLAGCTLTLDTLQEDGWAVGEVELMTTREEAAAARLQVTELVNTLGFSPQRMGKVRHCLKLHNKKAYEVLNEIDPIDE